MVFRGEENTLIVQTITIQRGLSVFKNYQFNLLLKLPQCPLHYDQQALYLS